MSIDRQRREVTLQRPSANRIFGSAETAGRKIQHRGESKGGVTFKDPNHLAMERDLENILGMKVVIMMNGEFSGNVSVEFRDLDQFDEIARRLAGIPKV